MGGGEAGGLAHLLPGYRLRKMTNITQKLRNFGV